MSLIFWYLVCERVSWCLTWSLIILSHQKSLCKHVFQFPSFATCLCFVIMILNIYLPPRNISIHSLSLISDNFICGIFIDHIYFGLCSSIALFVAKACFGIIPYVLLVSFGSFLLYSKCVLCFLELRKARIPLLRIYIRRLTSIQCTILGGAILHWVEHLLLSC